MVIDEVAKNKGVLQTGSMQRSSKEFRIACELVQNGVIGEVEKVICNFGDPGVPCDLPEEEMEPGLDWERWVGPAQMRPLPFDLEPTRFCTITFRVGETYKEFGGGMVTDWGAHHLDIAQWGLGMDGFRASRGDPAGRSESGNAVCTLKYANGVTVTHGGGAGVEFYGSKGLVQVNRGRFALTLNGEVEVQVAGQGGSFGQFAGRTGGAGSI